MTILFINSFHLDILWELLLLHSTLHHFVFLYSVIEADIIFLRLAVGRHHEMEPCYKKLLWVSTVVARERERGERGKKSLVAVWEWRYRGDVRTWTCTRQTRAHRHSKDSSVLRGAPERGQVQIPGKRECARRGYIPLPGWTRVRTTNAFFRFMGRCVFILCRSRGRLINQLTSPF